MAIAHSDGEVLQVIAYRYSSPMTPRRQEVSGRREHHGRHAFLTRSCSPSQRKPGPSGTRSRAFGLGNSRQRTAMRWRRLEGDPEQGTGDAPPCCVRRAPRVELIPGGAKTFLWPLCDRVGREWTSGPSSIAVGPSPLLTEPMRGCSVSCRYLCCQCGGGPGRECWDHDRPTSSWRAGLHGLVDCSSPTVTH